MMAWSLGLSDPWLVYMWLSPATAPSVSASREQNMGNFENFSRSFTELGQWLPELMLPVTVLQNFSSPDNCLLYCVLATWQIE